MQEYYNSSEILKKKKQVTKHFFSQHWQLYLNLFFMLLFLYASFMIKWRTSGENVNLNFIVKTHDAQFIVS